MPGGFKRDPKWVIFPRLTYQNHLAIEKRQPILADDFSGYRYNETMGQGNKAVVTGGVSYAYVREALELLGGEAKLLKTATPHPFPEKLALSFLEGVDEVLVVEELSPVLEHALVHLVGKHHLKLTVLGKDTGHIGYAGENTVESVAKTLASFLNLPPRAEEKPADMPRLAVRPPVLCAGCPHRASFYAVKKAMAGRKACFSGDIGCYTLGNAQPLDMVDTCLCMGAGITVAQGLHRRSRTR